MFLVADDQRRVQVQAGRGQRAQAADGLLEQAAVAVVKHQKLLRVARARQRPQPRAAAAGHDDGLNLDG